MSATSTLDRRGILLQHIDMQQSLGAEIGPLHSPLVDRSAFNVLYVDHCDTATLRERWSTDPAVDISRLHVDAVWGDRTLADAIRAALEAKGHEVAAPELDYVVASHVIEHVPDLVTWLHEVRDVLRADPPLPRGGGDLKSGRLRLAVPDKRYTFDRLRRTSILSDVLEAYAIRRRVPSSHCIVDFALHAAKVDILAAWRGSLDETSLEHMYTPRDAVGLARDAEQNGTYHDVHCWVFTPHSFVELMIELAQIDLQPLACEWIVDTAHNTFEFFVSMVPADSSIRALTSWQQALRSLPVSA